MPAAAMGRIMAELQRLDKETSLSGIYVRSVSEDDVTKWDALIVGPLLSPYW